MPDTVHWIVYAGMSPLTHVGSVLPFYTPEIDARGIVSDIAADPVDPSRSALVAVGYEFAKGRIANNTPDHYGLGVVRVEYDPAAQGEDTWKAAELIEVARRPQPLRKARVIAFDPHRTNRVYAGSDGCGVAVGIRRPVTEP